MLDLTLHNSQLDGETFTYPGGSEGLLLLHGFTATTAEVRLLADYLRPFGYTISAPLLPGHGTSVLDLQETTWDKWTTFVEGAYLDLAGKCEKVAVAGESMGGLLALYLASQYPDIASIVAFAPAVKVRRLWSAQFIRFFTGFSAKKNMDDGLPWKGYKYNPLKAGTELYKFQHYMNNKFINIHQPVAIFLGGKDATIDNQAAEHAFHQLSSTKKSLTYYQNSSHCMILDRDWRDIARDTKIHLELGFHPDKTL